MVQITEFRVVMPLSLEEYRVAQMYMVAKMQQYNTTGKEGVEVLENRPFEDLQLGKGMYTRKVYHLQSKIPGWLASFTPPNALLLEEEAWNDFPNCKAVLKCPYFPRFKLTVDTVHVADRGFSSNVHKLDDASLAIRKVEMVDIGSDATDYWSYMIGGPSVDLRTLISKKTGRGLLSAGWQDTCTPVMTAYKLVTVDAPYWGFGYQLEQAILGAERALFLESHKHCFAWIDEWSELSVEDVRQLELETDEKLKEAFREQAKTLNGHNKKIAC
ncbi:hypothetical protein O6H91_04G108100 [Diphasiastrum complanatum]|uniref:Uncharacterized protein n=3 Tax=Diphasiastrum complanatum TaxID=34168 RepID=A0ACC2E0B2_DIPCM|nr:hypothetical protein O6H91_04G108100 [Diphasiastrum complanatum]